MRRAAVVLAAGTVALGAAGLAGAGDREPLAWDGTVRVVTPPELPGDRVLVARVRNTGETPLRLLADEVRITDADGRQLRSTARFAGAFGHALYSPRDAPAEVAAAEQERLGVAVSVPAGESVPVTLSWRLRAGAGPAVAAHVGDTVLKLPGNR